MKVLSLFDGISCGMVALERAGIDVERYVAYEIDKYAVTISKKNYPLIEHHGDVFQGDFTQYKGFDLLIGGSPCTYWSIAKNDREITPSGIGGRLFMEYVRALKESECRYFLYENNFSIHKDIKAYISDQLGVEPIMINSALVSAQNRKRCYWTNIPCVTQPNDRHILLKDVLLNNAISINENNTKSHTITASYPNAYLIPIYKYGSERSRQRVVERVEIPEATKKGFVEISLSDCVDLTQPNSKTRRGRDMKDKANCLTTTNAFYQYLGEYLKSTSYKGKIVLIKLGETYYYDNGKMVKVNMYGVNLKDGIYLFRKLTPIEAERLQTLPDDYTASVSDRQRYKAIGNGWTVDVIAHILKGLKGE